MPQNAFNNRDVFAIVLAGGQSSRLFPFNKVLSDLTGSGESLLQQAVYRTSARLASGKHSILISPDHLYVLTAASLVPAMRSQLGFPASHFLIDPIRRGTWPALLWAMAHVRVKNPQALLAVVTGDHVIGQVPRFRQAVAEALALARRSDVIALIGVKPGREPAEWTGFGAFHPGKTIRFEEKPSLPRAGEMIREGGWLWNAGMFFFRIAVAEAALERCQPAMNSVYRRLIGAVAQRDRQAAAAVFAEFPSKIPHPLDPGREADNTMDYAILSPLVQGKARGLGAAVARTALNEWKDVGQWPALRGIIKADRRGNVVIGRVDSDSTVRRCILAADRKMRMTVRGAEGLIAAVSGDRALVIPEPMAGRIKEFTASFEGPLLTRGTEGLAIILSRGHLRIHPAS